MKLFRSAIEKEWSKLMKEETYFIDKNLQKEDSKLTQFLSDKVPTGLQDTLDATFAKAFHLVFEKGTDVIEKTFKKDEIVKDYKINDYSVKIKENRKNLKAFSKKANSAGKANLLISGASGIGMGVIGVGIPDIVVFTSLMLRSVYEICLHYGYNYRDEEEKKYILLLIQGAVCHNTYLLRINEQINHYIQYKEFSKEISLTDCIEETAKCLSKELLYMKFLQGIPLVGVVGGAYDVVYMKQINKFAELKYRRRFLEEKKRQEI